MNRKALLNRVSMIIVKNDEGRSVVAGSARAYRHITGACAPRPDSRGVQSRLGHPETRLWAPLLVHRDSTLTSIVGRLKHFERTIGPRPLGGDPPTSRKSRVDKPNFYRILHEPARISVSHPHQHCPHL